jgi:hypothetical protein
VPTEPTASVRSPRKNSELSGEVASVTTAKGGFMSHDVEEDEQILERTGAIDVAKAWAKVCVRLPGVPSGQSRLSRT